MPIGTPYKSFILPYPIRVDDFTSLPDSKGTAALHLLTHTHTDHLNGLSARSFAQIVVCSYDAKEMLLRHEVYAERFLKEQEIRAENVRTFSHLKIDPTRTQDGAIYYTGARDLLKPLPLNTPTCIELNSTECITVTLFDANHCPGAVMYLIEGARGSVLHTGDFRAEPWFLESLTKNPFIQKYLAVPSAVTATEQKHRTLALTQSYGITQTLEAIYLDTACLLGTLNVPTKDEATSGLVSLMSLLPVTTMFFINAWTWGYEDILKAIARAFGSKIHVDRYKYSVYSHIRGDPFLQSILTEDAASTRFHACERFDRCGYVSIESQRSCASTTATNTNVSLNKQGRHVIYVNPVTMGAAGWELYLKQTKAKLQNGEVVNHLLVPLSRHSPLPELQAFVSLFRPRRVIPNTLDPAFKGLDWACMRKMFEGCLASDEVTTSAPAMPQLPQFDVSQLDANEIASLLLAQGGVDEDVSLKNLEGEGALEVAERWAQSGKSRRKLEIMKEFLQGAERRLVERILDRKKGNIIAACPSPVTFSKPTNFTHSAPRQIPKRLASKPSIGRASMAETAAAMARVRFVPPVFTEPDSDEDTEDEDAEMERAKTAHHLFAEMAGVSVDDCPWGTVVARSSSSSAEVLEESTAPNNPGADRESTPLRVDHIPLTPSSENGSRSIMRMVSESSPDPHTSLQRNDHRSQVLPLEKSLPSTPTLPYAGRGLASPIHLSSTSKRAPGGDLKTKLAQNSTPDTLSDHQDSCASSRSMATTATRLSDVSCLDIPCTTNQCSQTPAYGDSSENRNAPLLDMHNLTKRPLAVDYHSMQDGPSTAIKRRRVDQSHEIRSHTNATIASSLQPRSTTLFNIHEDLVVSSDPSLATRQESDRRESTLLVGGSGLWPATASTMSASSSSAALPKDQSKKRRSTVKLDSRTIAEKLFLARPDLVARRSRSSHEERRRGRIVSRQISPTVIPESPEREERSPSFSTKPSHIIPSELPSQDQHGGDVEMDIQRTRKLADFFRQELAKGRRPGIVIPRLTCLESQEERP